MKRRLPILLIVLGCVVVALGVIRSSRRNSIVLTGIVMTDEVIVSAEVQGRIEKLLVQPGDTVHAGELLAQIQPQEWKADVAFYANSEGQVSAQVAQAEADLRFQETLSSNQVSQAEANLAAAQAQAHQAEVELGNAHVNADRLKGLFHQGVESIQTYDQIRTTFESAQAHFEALQKQVASAQAAVGLAKADSEQVDARRAALIASQHQLAAAAAQKEKAQVRLNHTEIRAPNPGIVDIRAALSGEVVTAGQPILTIINPDNLWVRADVEETWIDHIHLGEKLQVRLPSGAVREGVVFYRSVDADYATQRDVSRTKRDIKTFEIRLRCDNTDRSLAVGMTAYVRLPLQGA